MRRLIDFYKLQIQVMRTWRPSSGSRVRRIIATLIVSALSFLGAVFLTPGVSLEAGSRPFLVAVAAALVLGVLNVLIRPVFIAAFAGISVIAVVIATLVFQRFLQLLVKFVLFRLLVVDLILFDRKINSL